MLNERGVHYAAVGAENEKTTEMGNYEFKFGTNEEMFSCLK